MNKNLFKAFGSIIFLIIIILIFSLTSIVGMFTDYMWFSALGFSQLFLISLKSKISLFAVTAGIFFTFAIINLILSSKLNKDKNKIISFKLKLLVTLILSLVIGVISSSKWFTVLQYLKQFPFNVADPIFAKDISFYIFTLPFLNAAWAFAFSILIITIILVTIDYLQSFLANLKQTTVIPPLIKPGSTEIPKPQTPQFDIKGLFDKIKSTATVHLALLGSLAFVLLAVKHYLARFSIMYSKKGIVVGAGYADVVAYLPMIKILMIFAIVVAVFFIIWIFAKKTKIRKRHILLYVIFLYVLFGIIGPTAIPGLVQTFKVTPNEINLETPYINNNIKFTRMAYGLSDVQEQDFPVEMSLTPDILYNAKETIDNVRILDWRPLTQTYKQTQEIRLYYDLSGIDIDRYTIDGKYTQVMLAPREMDQGDITENAKTWVNLHMIYTHGFGIVMSPVNEVTKQGLPNFLIQDIPPIYNIEEESIRISKPQVYYGENENDFVLVNTKTNEFDYPKGNTNQYINYDGEGGVQLDSFLKKVLMAIRFGDIKILLSSDLTPESKIMFQRNIQDRILKLTPFIALDEDPYLVIDDGNLYWIQDAYTLSGNYPYSEKYQGLNYLRNSVKVVVDAYDGDVTYYVIDKTDPIIMTYANIFPKQFKSFDSMPDSLKEHIRYPEDLFHIQSHIYNTYHMDDATVFYNKEDAWQTPSEIYGVGQQVSMDSYYIIMKLPGETKEEFVLMRPFTPIKKDNMIAWMAARSDGENYGKLTLYKFPKDKLVYGPLQIEAKIDQDSEISQQLTLWSQQGSKVTRGNLLIIPIDNSILYIEPLYIQAEQGQLPELKRVLVSDGEQVVMEKDLKTALEVLFGKAKKRPVVGDNETTVEKTSDQLITEANTYYSQILQAMNNNNWSAIGDNFDNLGTILEELSS